MVRQLASAYDLRSTLALALAALAAMGGCRQGDHAPTGATLSAAATVMPSLVRAGFPVIFRGSASSSAGTVGEYQWAFGDGATASGPTVTHAYMAPGTYTVTLTVYDSLGLMETDIVQVEVTAQGGPPILTIDRVVIRGSINEHAATVRMDGAPVLVEAGRWSASFAPVPGERVTRSIISADPAGNQAAVTLRIARP